MNTNFKVIGLTRLGIKPKSTAPEADALTTYKIVRIISNVKTNERITNNSLYKQLKILKIKDI